jgi:dihydrolipoamide dehydrogenase
MVVGEFEIGTDVMIIGAGPAGYTTAIRCGQNELDTTLVDTGIGGVCLNHGCIPFKAIMHSLDTADAVRSAGKFGVRAGNVSVDMGQVQAWKENVVDRIGPEIKRMIAASSVQYLKGTCSFTSSTTALVRGERGNQHIRFKRAVIATGAVFRPAEGVRIDGTRILTPDQLDRLKKMPASAAILGGGIYGARSVALLGKMDTRLVIAFREQSFIPEVDDDVVRPVFDRLGKKGAEIFPRSSWSIAPDSKKVTVTAGSQVHSYEPEVIVMATPQAANVGGLNLGSTKVTLDDGGFIAVDGSFRTSDDSIYALGDVLGKDCFASIAFREGYSLAETLAGRTGLPGYQARPLTISTDPPIASAGIGETEARKRGLDIIVGISPYGVNGAAIASDRTDGLVKVVAERASHRIIGIQAAGYRSIDFIGEGVLALEMGARLEDVALTVHPHPEPCEELYDACARAAGLSYLKQR